MNKSLLSLLLVAAGITLSACEQAGGDGPEPYASRYQPLPSEPVLLQGATVLTGTGERLDDADVAMRDGKIVAVGRGLDASGMTVIDVSGMWVTPGVIDVHSHLGAYPSPGVEAHSDGNEAIAVSHGEGRVEVRDNDHLNAIENSGTVALRYVDNNGNQTQQYPNNPNGSPNAITGLTTTDGRVTIMMPHPERVFRTVANSWSPEGWGENGAWMRMFQNARKNVG